MGILYRFWKLWTMEVGKMFIHFREIIVVYLKALFYIFRIKNPDEICRSMWEIKSSLNLINCKLSLNLVHFNTEKNPFDCKRANFSKDYVEIIDTEFCVCIISSAVHVLIEEWLKNKKDIYHVSM